MDIYIAQVSAQKVSSPSWAIIITMMLLDNHHNHLTSRGVQSQAMCHSTYQHLDCDIQQQLPIPT